MEEVKTKMSMRMSQKGNPMRFFYLARGGEYNHTPSVSTPKKPLKPEDLRESKGGKDPKILPKFSKRRAIMLLNVRPSL